MVIINLLTDVARLLHPLPLSSLTLSKRSSMSADQAVLLAYQLIAKLNFKPYESLIKPLACVSTHSSANAFQIRSLSERSSWSPERPWVKRQEDGWLHAVRESTFRMSTWASFHQFSIGGRSFLIVSNLNKRESRLGLDGLAGLDCQRDRW